MFSRLLRRDESVDPIDSLIADAQLRLHDVEFGSDEYEEITDRIFKLRRTKEGHKTAQSRKRLELIGEIIGIGSTILFAVKPELALKYSRLYWNWQLSRLFGFWR